VGEHAQQKGFSGAGASGAAKSWANIRARSAREAAAAREADRAEVYAWPVQMEGYGGPAQPPRPSHNASTGIRLAGSRMPPLQDPRESTARRDPTSARHAYLET
jgi:hypothetical protein